jgi:hypothetical protein
VTNTPPVSETAIINFIEVVLRNDMAKPPERLHAFNHMAASTLYEQGHERNESELQNKCR